MFFRFLKINIVVPRKTTKTTLSAVEVSVIPVCAGGGAQISSKNIEKLRIFKLLRTITTRSEVDKNRIADVFKWSKGFGRYFNAPDKRLFFFVG